MMFSYFYPYPYPYAVGASDPFTPALQSASTMEGMLKAIEPGTKFGQVSYTDEVAAFQKAGQYGVDVVAPAIDAAGVPGVTQPLTHKAWDLNAQLHSGIRTWGAFGPGYQEVQQARTLAWQMLLDYKHAILDGQQTMLQTRQAPRQIVAAPVASGPLQLAAQALLGAIRSATQAGQPIRWTRERGQSSVLWQPTANFQRAYNASSGGSLKVDGVFGAETTKALQAVVGTNTLRDVYTQAAATTAVSGGR